ncbi:MAG: 3-hydroxyacyl-ACP dehydratase [Candidatus Riflebacteria bacterium]|nr:3-hydroxyacyl-ACP dehydratase [Candidatus Riflebacteria bacterium]
MRVIGLDLGSRRTKAVLLIDGVLHERAVFDSWNLAKETVSAWVYKRSADAIGATGYGRRLAATTFNAAVITEIAAFARGASLLAPNARMLVDIGGQDAKIIRLDENGNAADFEMNDRCAAGTGKFFELLSRTLGMPLEELPAKALSAAKAFPISSTCAVFAESEIIGRLAEGADAGALALGVFRSVAERLTTMISRVGFTAPAILVGGGANVALAAELAQPHGEPFGLPDDGSYFGAVGVALHAASMTSPVRKDLPIPRPSFHDRDVLS